MSDADAEAAALHWLVNFMPQGATASQLDRSMLSVGEESMSLGELEAGLERCLTRGEVELLRLAPNLYRITEKGRARLRGEK